MLPASWREVQWDGAACAPVAVGDYIENEVPQPQDEEALGLLMTKRAPMSSSVKSISASARNGRETGSMRTLAPPFSSTRSSGCGRGFEVDVVLEARAAAALDGDAQARGLGVRGDLGEAGEGAVGDAWRDRKVHAFGPIPDGVLVGM